MRKKLLLAAACCLVAAAVHAQTVNKTASWNWPTANTDGSALSQSQISGLTIYDTNVVSPGQPGTPITCSTTIPPTTTTGTCAVAVVPGHAYVAVVQANGIMSAVSNSVTIPFVAPNPVTNFTIQ